MFLLFSRDITRIEHTKLTLELLFNLVSVTLVLCYKLGLDVIKRLNLRLESFILRSHP